MYSYPQLLALATLFSVAVGCDAGARSAAGFRLPSDGSVERGRAVFVSLECHRCHQVMGDELPNPVAQPPVGVALGGEVQRALGDGYLVTSIINPSHQIVRSSNGLTTVGQQSRMPMYDQITVRQLTDVVAYLQSKYRVHLTPPIAVVVR